MTGALYAYNISEATDVLGPIRCNLHEHIIQNTCRKTQDGPLPGLGLNPGPAAFACKSGIS